MVYGPTVDTIPGWSADGKWIYFSSTRSGRSEIWKVPAAGGQAVQMTRKGGLMPRESPDGQFVYYRKDEGGLWRMPVAGGDESQVVPSVYGRNYILDSRGIYSVSPRGDDGKYQLGYLPLDGGKPKTVLTLSHAPMMGMALSPDGLSLLYTQYQSATEELVLVESFK
jgi:Tol biopolymer transport system component